MLLHTLPRRCLGQVADLDTDNNHMSDHLERTSVELEWPRCGPSTEATRDNTIPSFMTGSTTCAGNDMPTTAWLPGPRYIFIEIQARVRTVPLDSLGLRLVRVPLSRVTCIRREVGVKPGEHTWSCMNVHA